MCVFGLLTAHSEVDTTEPVDWLQKNESVAHTHTHFFYSIMDALMLSSDEKQVIKV